VSISILFSEGKKKREGEKKQKRKGKTDLSRSLHTSDHRTILYCFYHSLTKGGKGGEGEKKGGRGGESQKMVKR